MRPEETQDYDAVHTLPPDVPPPGDTTKRTPPGHVLPLPGPPAAPATDRLGAYELIRELARGGMGVVHEAEHVQLRRRVALKIMRGGDPEEVERFLLEARAVARLRHPNVVAIHDVGRDGARWFLAMDLVDGESLRRRVERDGPLAPEEAARATEDVARALQRATTDTPLAAQGWLIRGLVRYRRGELPQARLDLERFLQLGPDHPQAEWARELLRDM